jgi:hypothetical protein
MKNRKSAGIVLLLHLLSGDRSATKRGRQVFRFSSKQYYGQKGGKELIAEADWQLSLVDDDQPRKKIEPRHVICSAGSNLDSHATGSFIIENQGNNSRQAILFFGGRKYGAYNLSCHDKQRIQADAWCVNLGVRWYVTTPNPFSPAGQQIEAAGPIYNTERGSEAGLYSPIGWPESDAYAHIPSIDESR